MRDPFSQFLQHYRILEYKWDSASHPQRVGPEAILPKICQARRLIYPFEVIERAVPREAPGEDQFELPLPFNSVFLEGHDCPLLSFHANQKESHVLEGVLIESQPWGEYLILSLLREPQERMPKAYCSILTRGTFKSLPPASILGVSWRTFHRFLDILGDKEITHGEQRVHTRIRAGVGDERKLYKLPSIVYLRPKASAAGDLLGGSGVPIRWCHKWETRGHWRRVAGVGKNSLGEYVVDGVTWVNPHIKGQGPIVIKKRIVKL